jgi:polar amino acid transport system substrate-binding protein
MGLDNIKVAGYSGFNDSLRIGVRKNDTLLHSIMSKLIRALPQKEIDTVYQKWVVLKFEHKFNYSILWKIAAAAVPVLVLIIAWNRKLMNLNRKIASQHQELMKKSEKLELLSITDQLTGLFNRRHINNTLATEIERIDRYNRPLSIIILDIDHFKKVNDTYGHQIGDTVLCRFAETISENIRKSDIAGRWGGEEFLIICPENDLEGVSIMAEHLRKVIEKTDFPVKWKQTASFGVACYQPPETKDSFINRADRALYMAKENGRNRVEHART